MNANRRVLAALLLCDPVLAQTPGPVLDLLRTATQALSERDTRRFLEQFDPAMPRYDALARNAALLVASQGAESSIEVIGDEGDGLVRRLELDWLLRAGASPAKRQVVKVTVERRARTWKITALDPVEFFAQPSSR
jgi:hypothetical protein